MEAQSNIKGNTPTTFVMAIEEKESNRIQLDSDNEDGIERSHTFRERRLTYTSHQLKIDAAALAEFADFDSNDDDDTKDEKDGAQIQKISPLINSKRSLDDLEDANPPNPSNENKRSRMGEQEENDVSTEDATSAATTATDSSEAFPASSSTIIKSRVLHASAPPRPSCPHRQCHLLYQYPPNAKDTLSNSTKEVQPSRHEHDSDPLLIEHVSPHSDQEPEWKKIRHTKGEDESLPFPSKIVGTYSCYGIEPVYELDDFHLGYNGIAPSATAKINQDRGGVTFPYANCVRSALFAAYDGHGVGGELVSQFALHEIPKRLELHEDYKNGNIEKAFKDVFIGVNDDLRHEKDIEPAYGGCTACVALVKESDIYLSNAGDSRAVIASQRVINGKVLGHKALDLTVDQNPDSPGEQERIVKSGGFVSPPPEEGLSARVWLDAEYTQIGLAMARSLGDYAVKNVGVIAEPVVTRHQIREEDDFMIIATDGVWEFLSSQEAVDIVSNDFRNGECSSFACQHLIEAAAAKWHEHEGDYRDDITALVIKVRELWKN